MTTSMENTSFGSAPSPEPAIIRRPLDHCPACNSWQLRPVVAIEAEEVHFLCGSCNRCWRAELGFVGRVPPGACDGCPQRERCSAAYAADHAAD